MNLQEKNDNMCKEYVYAYIIDRELQSGYFIILALFCALILGYYVRIFRAIDTK